MLKTLQAQEHPLSLASMETASTPGETIQNKGFWIMKLRMWNNFHPKEADSQLMRWLTRQESGSGDGSEVGVGGDTGSDACN